ncbi:MAG: hypothetical protein O3B87_04400 [bacterium]|nr:hypothetical protein [bacterium]
MKKIARKLISVFAIALLLMQSIFTPFLISPVYAATSWTQTDWSSGVGASTTNQYSSGSSIDATTTSGQVVSSKTEKLSNTGFESDLTSWTYAGATNYYDSVPSIAAGLRDAAATHGLHRQHPTHPTHPAQQ